MTSLRSRIHDSADDPADLELLRAAIAVPSVTGTEAAFARFVARSLRAAGVAQVTVEQLAPGRANVLATASGPGGGGGGLMFLGHLDTVAVRGWTEHWAEDPRRSDPFGGAIVDGSVWGRGAGDLKAGICAVIGALALLRRHGVTLVRDVGLAFVADEESGEPGLGTSLGMKAALPALTGGRRPELAIYVEPTQLDIYSAQLGFLIADITVTGAAAYFGTPRLGVDAVRAGAAVLQALWEYCAALEKRPPHPLVGSPSLLVTGITGGEGYIAVPGTCRITLIRKLIPGEDPGAARAELDAVIEGAAQPAGVRLRTQYPAPRDHPAGGTPYETDPGHEAIRRLSQVIGEIWPGRGEVKGAPYWSENPFIGNSLGIPAVYCAPGDISNCHTFDERVSIAEYHAAIRVYAAFMADICGVRDDTSPNR